MKITSLNIRKIKSEGRVKALVSITLDDEFVIHDIRVVESIDKTFVAMPSRRKPNGEFKDIVHPINNETRNYMEELILDRYKEIGE